MTSRKDRRIAALEKRVAELEGLLPDALLKSGIYDGQVVSVKHKTARASGRRYTQFEVRLDVGKTVWMNAVHQYTPVLAQISNSFGLAFPVHRSVEAELSTLVGERVRADVETVVYRDGRKMNGVRRLVSAR